MQKYFMIAMLGAIIMLLLLMFVIEPIVTLWRTVAFSHRQRRLARLAERQARPRD